VGGGKRSGKQGNGDLRWSFPGSPMTSLLKSQIEGNSGSKELERGTQRAKEGGGEKFFVLIPPSKEQKKRALRAMSRVLLALQVERAHDCSRARNKRDVGGKENSISLEFRL